MTKRLLILILTLLLWVMPSLATANTGAKDWNALLKKRIQQYWRKDAKVDAKIHRIPDGIPPSALLATMNTGSYVGLVPVEWSWVDQGMSRKAHGTSTVQVRTRIAVAKVPLANGQPIDVAQIDFVEHEVSPLYHTGFFVSSQELDRRKVRGYIAPGAILNARNTTGQLLVERGQVVTLSQIKGALQLGAQMESLESGALGEWVRVSHPKTHKVLRARVSGIGLVELN